jgi:hypothetical protein
MINCTLTLLNCHTATITVIGKQFLSCYRVYRDLHMYTNVYIYHKCNIHIWHTKIPSFTIPKLHHVLSSQCNPVKPPRHIPKLVTHTRQKHVNGVAKCHCPFQAIVPSRTKIDPKYRIGYQTGSRCDNRTVREGKAEGVKEVTRIRILSPSTEYAQNSAECEIRALPPSQSRVSITSSP